MAEWIKWEVADCGSDASGLVPDRRAVLLGDIVSCPVMVLVRRDSGSLEVPAPWEVSLLCGRGGRGLTGAGKAVRDSEGTEGTVCFSSFATSTAVWLATRRRNSLLIREILGLDAADGGVGLDGSRACWHTSPYVKPSSKRWTTPKVVTVVALIMSNDKE